jgi:hypothetical protein
MSMKRSLSTTRSIFSVGLTKSSIGVEDEALRLMATIVRCFLQQLDAGGQLFAAVPRSPVAGLNLPSGRGRHRGRASPAAAVIELVHAGW